MNTLPPDDGRGLFYLCFAALIAGALLWLLISRIFSRLTRRGEERIRRMEKLEHKLSARIK